MGTTKDMVDFWRWHYAEMLHEAGWWFDEVAKLRFGSNGGLDLDETKLAELALEFFESVSSHVPRRRSGTGLSGHGGCEGDDKD